MHGSGNKISTNFFAYQQFYRDACQVAFLATRAFQLRHEFLFNKLMICWYTQAIRRSA